MFSNKFRIKDKIDFDITIYVIIEKETHLY